MTRSEQIIRMAIDLDKPVNQDLVDFLTGHKPAFWRGTDVAVELAFYRGAVLADVSNFASISVLVKPLTARTGALVLPLLTSSTINNGLTLADWENGSNQHVRLTWANADTSPAITGHSQDYWIVFTGAITGSAKKITLGGSTLTIVEDGDNAGVSPTPGDPLYWTAAQSDVRYLLASAVTALTLNPGTTPADALILNIDAVVVAGSRNSHAIRWTARSFDTAAHQVDWKAQVIPTTTAGVSQLEFQNRVDAAAYGTKVTLYSTGKLRATSFEAVTSYSFPESSPGEITGAIGDTGQNLKIRGGNAYGVNTNGGTLYLYGGLKTGTGFDGDIVLGNDGVTNIGRVKIPSLTASRALALDAAGYVVASAVTATELGYLSGVTSAIQTQIAGKLGLAGGTITGTLSLVGKLSAQETAVEGNYPIWSLFGGIGRHSNMITYSEDFSAASWVMPAGGTLASNTIVAPEGSATADVFTPAAVGNYLRNISVTGNANTRTFTCSIWMKVAAGTKLIRFGVIYNGDAVVGFSDVTVTTTWQRFSFTVTAAVTTTSFGAYVQNNTDTTAVHIWGIQLEESATLGAYVKTTATGILVSRKGGFFSGDITATDGSIYSGTFIADNATKRIGINVTSPLGPIHAEGDLDGAVRYYFTNKNVGASRRSDIAILTGATASNVGLFFGVDQAATAYKSYLDNRSGGAFQFQNAGVSSLAIGTTGLVGFGAISAPSFSLHARTNGGVTMLFLDSDVTANQTSLALGYGGASKWQIYRPPSTDDLAFYDSANRMYFQGATGRIGIGNSAPARTLDITGNLRTAQGAIIAAVPAAEITTTWNNAGVAFTGRLLNVTNTASSALSLVDDVQIGGVSKFCIDVSGRIGIGDSTPNYTIDLAGTLRIQGTNALNLGGTGAADAVISLSTYESGFAYISGGLELASCFNATADPGTLGRIKAWSDQGTIKYRSTKTNEGAGRNHFLHNTLDVVVSSGTDFAFAALNTYARIDAGGTDCEIPLVEAARYALTATITIQAGASGSVYDIFTFKLYDSVTLADIPNSERSISNIPASSKGQLIIRIPHTTTAVNRTIQIYGKNETAIRGSVISVQTSIEALRTS